MDQQYLPDLLTISTDRVQPDKHLAPTITFRASIARHVATVAQLQLTLEVAPGQLHFPHDGSDGEHANGIRWEQMLAYCTAHSIGTDDNVSLRRGTVFKVHSDSAVGALFEGVATLLNWMRTLVASHIRNFCLLARMMALLPASWTPNRGSSLLFW